MVTVARFAEAVLPHGTTTVLIDNHEIANVLGLDGIRWMLEEGRGLPLKVLLAVPSCVPALPGFEDAGAHLGPDDIREALTWDGVAALGEMMNMPGVYDADADTHEMIGAVLDAGLPVTGHWSLHGWSDHRLHAYVCAGVDSDHESVHREDALAKLRAGMWVQFREGSAWHDVAECVKVLTEDGVDSRHALLVTDDMHPETLLATGHLNHAVRTAIAAGLDPLLAIQLATVNAAEYIGRRHDVGSIAPGRCADILLVEDLTELRPHRVIADGRTIDAGAELPRLEPPAAFRRTVHLQRPLTAADLRIEAAGETARGPRDRHGPRRARDRAPRRRGAGRRRRGRGRPGPRPRQGGEHRAPRRLGVDRPRLRPGARASRAARSRRRSRTTTTTSSSSGRTTPTCSPRSSASPRPGAAWSPSRTARRRRSSSCRSPACSPTGRWPRSRSRSARSTAPTRTSGRRSSTRS